MIISFPFLSVAWLQNPGGRFNNKSLIMEPEDDAMEKGPITHSNPIHQKPISHFHYHDTHQPKNGIKLKRK